MKQKIKNPPPRCINANESANVDEVELIHNKSTEIIGWSLRMAAAEGNLNDVKNLVKNGADVRSGNDYALSWAFHNGHINVAKYLIESGADYKNAGIDFEDLPTEIKIFLWNKELEGES